MITIFSLGVSSNGKHYAAKLYLAGGTKQGAGHNAALLELHSNIPVKLKPICLSQDSGKLVPSDKVK